MILTTGEITVLIWTLRVSSLKEIKSISFIWRLLLSPGLLSDGVEAGVAQPVDTPGHHGRGLTGEALLPLQSKLSSDISVLDFLSMFWPIYFHKQKNWK